MRTAFSRALIFIILMAAGSGAGSIAFSSEGTVGGRGDPDQIEFRGNLAFSQQDIVQALTKDFDFWLKGSSYAQLQDFCDYLNQNILAGYLKAGFGEAKVSADPAPDGKIIVSITEGPRYRAGEIVVSGNERITPEKIVERLTTTARPRSFQYSAALVQDQEEPEIIWPIGKPAPLDGISLKSIGDELTKLFREGGYREAEIKPEIELTEDLQARLRIEIVKEGPKCRLGRIIIEGAGDKLPEDQLRPQLFPAPGEMVGQLEVAEIEYFLWSLGKYLSYQVELVPSEAGEDWRDIRIVLEESEDARSWKEETGEVEAVLWKTHAWLYDAANWKKDLVFSGNFSGSLFKKPEWTAVNATLVISPGRGAYLEVEGWGRVIITPKLVNWSFDHLKMRGSRESRDHQVSFFIEVSPGTFNMGFGWKSGLRKYDSIFKFEVAIAPASIGKLENRMVEWSPLTIADGCLRIANEAVNLDINALTGELNQFSVQSDTFSIRIQTRPGFFQSKLTEFELAARDYPVVDNVVIAAALLLSDKICRAEGDYPAQAKEIYLAANLAQFGKLLSSIGPGANEKETFIIPRPPEKTSKDNKIDLQKIIRALPGIAHSAFLRESWPWTLCRGLALTSGGDPRELLDGVIRFYSSDDIGPLGCLAFGLLQKNKQKKFWGEKGLKQLDFDSFLKDFLALFPEGRTPRKVIDWELEVVQGIKEPDLDRIGRGLGDGIGGKLLKTFRDRCRNSSGDCLTELLKTVWNEYLEEKVKTGLDKLVHPDTQNDQAANTPSAEKPEAGQQNGPAPDLTD